MGAFFQTILLSLLRLPKHQLWQMPPKGSPGWGWGREALLIPTRPWHFLIRLYSSIHHKVTGSNNIGQERTLELIFPRLEASGLCLLLYNSCANRHALPEQDCFISIVDLFRHLAIFLYLFLQDSAVAS